MFTKTVQKIVEARVKITQSDPEDLAFLAKQVVLCNLPHRNPGVETIWHRRNGNFHLRIQAGLELETKGDEKPKQLGLPYGSIPRLLLFWITTEAIRTQSRTLYLGESLAEFMRAVGLNSRNGTGIRSDTKRLKEQMERLFAAQFSFVYNPEERVRWGSMQVAPDGEFWWDFKNKNTKQIDLFKSWIELGEKFYQAIIQAPIPIDVRVLKAIKGSPMLLDLYSWLSYRIFTVTKKGKGQRIPWRAIQKQIGSQYTDFKDFQKKAKTALKKVLLALPQPNIKIVDGGILIHPSQLAIPEKPRNKLSTKKL